MIKKNITLIVVVVLTTALSSFLIYNGAINITILTGTDKGIHFNLLTVSSIIGGFMFSGLGLLVGVSGNRLVKELERASLMDRIYNNVLVGILFCVISILLSLVSIFNVYYISDIVKNLIVSSEVVTLALGIVCFLLSVLDLKFIISSIHKSSKVVPDDVIKGMKEQLKNGKNKKNFEENQE